MTSNVVGKEYLRRDRDLVRERPQGNTRRRPLLETR